MKAIVTISAIITTFISPSLTANTQNQNHKAEFYINDDHQIAPPTTEKYKRFLEAAARDMQKPHELEPNGGGPGWRKKPLIVMGTEPYRTSVPRNWEGKNSEEWRAILPWFVIYEGKNGSKSTNSAVQIGGIELWYYSITKKKWEKIIQGEKPTWAGTYKPNAIDKVKDNLTSHIDKQKSTFTPSHSTIVHGGLGKASTPWNEHGSDIGAILVTVSHRLTTIDETKNIDMERAKFTINTGADYYPNAKTTLEMMGASYIPGVGLGRFIEVKREWRNATFFVKKDQISLTELTKEPPRLRHIH